MFPTKTPSSHFDKYFLLNRTKNSHSPGKWAVRWGWCRYDNKPDYQENREDMEQQLKHIIMISLES